MFWKLNFVIIDYIMRVVIPATGIMLICSADNIYVTILGALLFTSGLYNELKDKLKEEKTNGNNTTKSR